jgi:hypothetical protein
LCSETRAKTIVNELQVCARKCVPAVLEHNFDIGEFRARASQLDDHRVPAMLSVHDPQLDGASGDRRRPSPRRDEEVGERRGVGVTVGERGNVPLRLDRGVVVDDVGDRVRLRLA